MPTSITFTGWSEFRSKVKNLPVVVFEEIDGECEEAAHHWEELAKRDAPTDNGRLAQNITSSKVSMMNWEVTDPIFYAPYVEWGTGDRAVIPPELREYAARWWTKKKHIGMRPHPFFFIQKPIVESELMKNIQNILNTEH